jgi:V/A-type H+-transporting ATPase subunit I
MILPMKKVSLVVMEKSREEALDDLREIGVVHLEGKSVSSEALSKLLDRKTKAENVLGILRSYETKKKGPKKSAPAHERQAGGKASGRPMRRASDFINSEGVPYSSEALNAPDRLDFIGYILEIAEERKTLQDRSASLSRERSRIEVWGDFDPRELEALGGAGIVIFLYEFSHGDFAALPPETDYIVLRQDKAFVYAAVFGGEAPGHTPFALPALSLKVIDRELAEIQDQLADIEGHLASLEARKPAVEAELSRIQEEIEFETARAGMERLEDVPQDSTVAWITGFVPKDDLGLLKRAAAENGWALAADDPGPDDLVPTKLKNNRLASLIKPLTDFLEVTPGYNEVDISGWFLFFFVIFFGMIFGDAGYGALILILSLFGILKRAKKGVPPIFKLLFLLGLSNFAWGVLTCSWFGLKVAQIPEPLQGISLDLISNVRADKSALDKAIVQQNLMIFCFSLALLQLSIGHILAILHDKSLKILGHLGSIAMLGGMYFIILSLIASNEARRIPMYSQAVYVFAAGFAFNFVFAGYEGSIGRSILESFKNIISVILGIANVFSDIMSYIRLWAVGLAGAAIADTVDTMAFQIGGTAGPIAMHFIVFLLAMTLLVFGHGLNLVLNVLSVLVHGVRLNTLEFSGHVGLTWAGTAYRPFAKRAVRSREQAE